MWPSKKVICAHVALHIQAQKMEQELQIFTKMIWKTWCIWSIQFFYMRGRYNMPLQKPFVWWHCLWFLFPWVLVALVLRFTGGMKDLRWLPSPPTAHSLLRFSISQGWHRRIVPHYVALVLLGLFFSLVFYSLALFKFIALYPVRSCDSPKNWPGIRLHI